MSNNRIRKRRRPRINHYINTIKFFAAVIVTIIGINIAVDVARHPETYDTVAANSLRMDLNEGNRIDYYMENYIAQDKFLFSGPLTIELCAQYNNLDAEQLAKDFSESKYTSFQRFFDACIK